MTQYLELVSIILLSVAALLGFLALVGSIARRTTAPKKETEKPAVPEAPPAPPPPSDPYTHNQYDADLHNPQVSISDMLDQMQGEIPVPPPEGGNQSPHPGIVVPSPCQDEDRGKERQEWFEKLAEEVPPVEIVPPPPMQGPVMTVKGQLVPCPNCTSGGRAVASSSSFHGGNSGPGFDIPGPRYRCASCKDTLYIFLQHG